MPTAIKSYRLAAAAGALVIALSIAMSFFYVPALDGTPAQFSSPILALEFSSSLAEAQALFGGRDDIVRKFHIGHYLDMGFLLAYSALLYFANIGAWQRKKRGIFLLGSGCAIVAGCADFAENLQLMQLSHALLEGAPAPDFHVLRLLVSIKFSAISLAMLCLVPALWRVHPLGKVFTIATLLLSGATVLTVVGKHSASSAMMLMTAIAWGALWICLLITLRRSRLQPAA